MSNPHNFFVCSIGQLRCTAIRDNDDDDADNRCILLVEGRGQRVLIDAGNGDVTEPRGLLHVHLNALGIAPDEISAVILSHADFDHIGGAVVGGRPAFPQARYSLARVEWDYWSQEPLRARPSALADAEICRVANTVPPQHLLTLKPNLELFDPPCEVLPGFRAREAFGHTPGHVSIAIADGGEQLLHLGDLVQDSNDFDNPELHVFDVDPVQALHARQRLLAQAEREHSLLMLYHFPFPGIGYITQHDGRWQWEPLVTAGSERQ